MVRTAGSLFSPDTGSPLKRRVRKKYPPPPDKTLVVKVTTLPGFDSLWHFDHDVTLTDSYESELKIKNHNPMFCSQETPSIIKTTHDSSSDIGDAWAIDAKCKNLKTDYYVDYPQSGTVEAP